MLNDPFTDAKILIVDDQETNLDVLNDMLRREGYTRLHLTQDSSQVLALAADVDPDLILLDLHMPPPDGFELLERLRRGQRPEDYRPIIALTIDSSLETRRRALANGASDFLAKPLDVVETLLRIRNLLHARRLHVQTQRQNELLEQRVRERAAQLQAAEARYRDIFEQAVEGVFQAAPDGRFLTANHALAHMLGFASAEELLAASASTTDFYFDPAYQAAFIRQMEALGQVQDFEFRAHRRDGTPVWLSESSRAVRDAEGQLVHYEGFVQDVTLRRQAEEALAQERSLMQTLMENIPSQIYFKDRASRFIRISQSQARLFGLSDPAQAVGKTDFDFFTEEHARPAYEDEQEIIRTGQPLIKEEKETWADRPDTWVSTTKLPLHDKEGNIRGTFGISMDITERRRAEDDLHQRLVETETIGHLAQALRPAQTEDQLLAIFFDELLQVNGAPAGGLWLYPEGTRQLTPTLWRGWVEPLEFSEGKIGAALVERIHQTGEAYLTSDLKSDPLMPPQLCALASPGWQSAVLPFHTAQDCFGVVFLAVPPPRQISGTDLHLLKRLIEMGGNAIQRLRAHIRLDQSFQALQSEISIRRGIEDLLAKEKEMLSLSLQSIGEGVISTDPGGAIILFNPAAAAITGYTAVEALGQPIGQIVHLLEPQTHQVVDEPLGYLARLEREAMHSPHHRSPTLLTKTQEKILISGKITPLQANQASNSGYIIVFDNVTDRERLNAQSTLSQKMEAIGQLAAGIAHEINTPIQYVGDNINYLNRAFVRFKGVYDLYRQVIDAHRDPPFTPADAEALAALLADQKIGRYFEEFPAAIQEAQDGIERVRKIVLAIREFSHPSQKEKKLSDINRSIQTTITLSRNEWKYCAEMETDLEPDLPPVWCQVDEINQVLLNMIVNSAQAIQDHLGKEAEAKGKIRIETRQRGDIALISIQDTGGGIPPGIIDRIFDPFFTTKGVGRGTGQGLSIAHNIIVKKHQGQIRVSSEVGQGTTFTIELPIENSEEGMDHE